MEEISAWSGRKGAVRSRPLELADLRRMRNITQSPRPSSNALAADPVDVFGAASAATPMAEKLSVRMNPSPCAAIRKHNEKRRNHSSEFRGALT
jgi:hypothetical protein